VLIDNDLIRFCAQKTREVAVDHDKSCGAAEGEGLPRSAEDLHLIMMGRHGFPIYHRGLRIEWTKAKFRSFYVPKGEKNTIKECAIYYAKGLPAPYLRFYKTKELLQIHLWQESLVTRDIVELVQNMILRESPGSVDLNLGHPATSDTLGEIAAAEFLFPMKRRLEYLKNGTKKNGVSEQAELYNIPPFVVQRALSHVPSLREFFCPNDDGPDDKKQRKVQRSGGK